jgi:hypothetical protein
MQDSAECEVCCTRRSWICDFLRMDSKEPEVQVITMEVRAEKNKLAGEGSEMSVCLGQTEFRWGPVGGPQTPGRVRSAKELNYGPSQKI